MFKSLLILSMFIVFSDYNYSQVYSNVSEPFTQQINFKYEIGEVKQLVVKVPDTAFIVRKKKEGVFATNINVNFDLVENSTVYQVSNNKEIFLTRLRLENAKTLNFSFD